MIEASKVEEIFNDHVKVVTKMVNIITAGGVHIDGSIDRDDLLQVALFKAWRSIPEHDLTRGARLKTFIIRCARNAVYDEMRRARKGRGQSVKLDDSDIVDPEISELNVSHLSLDQLEESDRLKVEYRVAENIASEQEYQSMQDEVMEAVGELPGGYRDLIITEFVVPGSERMKNRRLREALGLNKVTMARRRRYAFAQLEKKRTIQRFATYFR